MIYLNDTPVHPTLFPDNTSQVWKLPEEQLKNNRSSVVRWDFSHEGEFLHLAQLKALLDHYNIIASLSIKYLPYGRQDKLVSNDVTFGLSVFAKLLNSLNFVKIIIYDPHSSVALDLINKSIEILPGSKASQVAFITESDFLCYPDKGAREKYGTKMPLSVPFIYGEKVRDQLTGQILSYQLIGNPKDKNILIVDDICDGGMTFKLLAQELTKAGAKEINLFVSHGIFSKGLRTLKESGINRIFTSDGECSEVQNQIVYRRL